MISVEHGLSVIEPWVITYGAVGLFVTVYFESFGAPLPGESALAAAGVLALRGDLPIAGVLVAAWLGAVLGDSTGYLIGRLGGRPLIMRFGPKIGVTAERFARVADQIRHHGFALVMTARFVAVLRQINGLVAGAVGMPLARFVAANALGGAFWVTAWALGPFLIGERFGLSLVH